MAETPPGGPPPEDTIATLKEAADQLLRTVTFLRKVVYTMAAVVGVVLVFVVVLQIQVSSMNRQLDKITTQTDKVAGFVDELKEERANGDGVSTEELRTVFKYITDTLTLLCNQFADDPICLQG